MRTRVQGEVFTLQLVIRADNTKTARLEFTRPRDVGVKEALIYEMDMDNLQALSDIVSSVVRDWRGLEPPLGLPDPETPELDPCAPNVAAIRGHCRRGTYACPKDHGG